MGKVAQVAQVSRAALAAAVVAAASLAAGCAATEWGLFKGERVPPPCQVVATWQNCVQFTPDPANQGKMSPGLAGRLYLFGPEIGEPLPGDGALSVALYDESKGEPVMREVWNIDPVTLKRLAKRDAIGTGYTVFLPWANYSPEVTRVRLKVCYKASKGTPLYTENQVALAATNGQISIQRSPPVVGR